MRYDNATLELSSADWITGNHFQTGATPHQEIVNCFFSRDGLAMLLGSAQKRYFPQNAAFSDDEALSRPAAARSGAQPRRRLFRRQYTSIPKSLLLRLNNR
jgi:hypothetical protein